jgi:hypothetical protein
MKRRGVITVATALAMLGMLSECDKKSLQPVTELKVRLTDTPLSAQEVNVDIKEVKVNYAKDTTWTSLKTNAGLYNLLDYQNGKDTLIAQGNVGATKIIQEMRLILGNNNTIKINNDVYPLNILTGFNSVQIVIGRKMNKNVESLIIDFNSGLSVTETTKGYYTLKPVLTLK